MLPPLSARTGLLSRGWAVLCLTLLVIQTARLSAGEFSPISLPGDQTSPAAVITEEGGVLVWVDNRLEGKATKGIMAAGLNNSLTATGSAFRVSQHLNGPTVGPVDRPQVARFSNGNYLFVWERLGRGKSSSALFGRVMAADGSFLTSDFQVSGNPTASTLKDSATWSAHFHNKWKQRTFKFRTKVAGYRENVGHAGVAVLADGHAAVVYQGVRRYETNTFGLEQDVRVNGIRRTTNSLLRPVRRFGDCMSDVFVQRVDALGQKVGAEILVNQTEQFNQRSPAIAAFTNGGFVVTWVSESQASSALAANYRVQVKGRIYDAQAAPVTDEFVIGASTEVMQGAPSVAVLNDGGFLVVWGQQESSDSRNWDVRGRTFAANGTPVGAEFTVNTTLERDQFGPRIVSAGDAQMVVWTSAGQDGSREGVYGRSLQGGAPDGGEFRLNDTTESRQFQPTIAVDPSGRVAAFWSGFADEASFDLFGRLLDL